MQRLSLNGTWELRRTGADAPIPAAVPGSVYPALIAAGRLPDPFYRDNEAKQAWVGETDWTYTRSFEVTPDVLARDAVLLRFRGLDTIATVSVNGAIIGRAENMYRTYEFDVKASLTVGTNTVQVDFEAPMPYMRQMDAEKGAMAGWIEPMRVSSGAWMRKEPCNFGWDWGPKLTTCGIWRDVELVAFNTARLTDVEILQDHSAGVSLTLRATAEQVRQSALRVTFAVSRDGKTVASATVPVEAGRAETVVTVPEPELWWPNGMGEQPLYEVTAALLDGETLLDAQTRAIGLRTLTLERHADEWGESFSFACNGVPFFAKGANWIPITPYIGTETAARYETFVLAAADANMNMLRVWGGGIYEDDHFYDLCDRVGITVWQDFIFACGTYPARDEAFMANVIAEAQENVRRLRHHACIALWCGNNEIEQGLPTPSWLETMSWDDYSHMFDGVLGDIVRELAPQTAYWPGSPHSPCGDRNDANNPACGDSHLWSVWHGREPFEWYRGRTDRFCSEFGFQSFPEPRVVEAFTLPEDRNITSRVMEHHQRSGIGNSTIVHYMLDWFRLPTSFENVIWLSQILQGMAMKYAVEHWRRSMPRSMGTLYWQLNDMWPAPSWASIDWLGNWKALHFMAKRFFAPVLISAVEDVEGRMVAVHVTSELNAPLAAEAVWTVTDAAGTPIEGGAAAVVVPPRTSAQVATVDLTACLGRHTAHELLVWLELRQDGRTISENLALLARPKHIDFAEPEIDAIVEAIDERTFNVTLTTAAPALYVRLELPGARFSDNFLDLRPGVARTVKIETNQPTDAIAVQAALMIQSLLDTYS
jgi:beta-mannosidase